jgi:VWFA-related protein
MGPPLRIRAAAFAAAFVLALGSGVSTSTAQEPAPTPFGTAIEVRRIVTEVRVVDSDGSPVLGLGPNDFTVEIGGDRAEVESVLWIPSTSDAVDQGTTSPGRELRSEDVQRAPEGRLIVILFQIDFGLHSSRTVGLVRMTPRASEFVSDLGPGDRVAVLVFDSHLELRADFTDDHRAVAEWLSATEVLGGRFEGPDQPPPLLAEHLDPEAMRDAATMAEALEVIGLALQEIHGPKSLVFFGYGLGQMSAGKRITIDDGYRRAMEALTDSRTSVFSLDVTNADYHSLAVGLRQVADDTGGFYVKTHLFPETAMAKLTRVISSYYELSIIPPPDLKESYSIKITVDRPRTDVYVRQDHPSPHVW